MHYVLCEVNYLHITNELFFVRYIIKKNRGRISLPYKYICTTDINKCTT